MHASIFICDSAKINEHLLCIASRLNGEADSEPSDRRAYRRRAYTGAPMSIFSADGLLRLDGIAIHHEGCHQFFWRYVVSAYVTLSVDTMRLRQSYIIYVCLFIQAAYNVALT